jgi:hypothetical protein
MRAALGLMKLLAQGEEDVRQGRTRPQAEVFADLEKALAGQREKGNGQG